ncbi:hypothetical protein HBB16_06210 [Pseudonocardia sp. MCCB 268]|nr:hypothetical protein [Pseudonocardia cytotoxica]
MIAGIATPIAMTVTLILFIVGPLAALVRRPVSRRLRLVFATEVGVGGGAFPAVVFVAACAMSMSTGTCSGPFGVPDLLPGRCGVGCRTGYRRCDPVRAE